jgi:hypothetical protein
MLAWAARVWRPGQVPPGWRDDELINMHALSGQVRQGSCPIYFLGASGHEPIYHYIQAGVQALVGYSVIGGHLLPAALGVLSVALTYVVARRLFGARVAVIGALALGTSFWSLMYSRVGLRHISVVPFVLLCVYLLWRAYSATGRRTVAYVSLGIAAGISMYTYFASRLIPLLIVGFLLYLFVAHRQAFRRHGRGLGLALLIALAIVTPMALAIVINVGSDPRIAELAGPLRALFAGEVRPLAETTIGTLGMFTTTGDPEWLYNLAGRPVFNLLGGMLLWGGVATCVVRWRRPEYFILVWWFLLGLTPGFASVPQASLGHTILAQPAAYVLPAVAIDGLAAPGVRVLKRSARGPADARRWALAVVALLAVAFSATNACRDAQDYFVHWPRESLVRFLYRGDYRDIARDLDRREALTDVAVGSTLLGPWDRLALQADGRRRDVRYRLFNPDRAVVWAYGGQSAIAVITDYPDPGSPFDALFERARGTAVQIGVTSWMYELPSRVEAEALLCGGEASLPAVDALFANGIALERACWRQNTEAIASLVVFWRVAGLLDLVPVEVTAYPPPPGVYVGTRLAVFAHLESGDGPYVVDDGLWVDAQTLQVGDSFAQVHRFELGPSDLQDYTAAEVGLYDPLTGERVGVLTKAASDDGDWVTIPLGAESR